MARTLPEVISDAQRERRLTDDALVAATKSHESGGFTRQTLSAIRKGRPLKAETFEALMHGLGLDANEIRSELGWPLREVAEPFIHGSPHLDQLNQHYRTQVVRIGQEFLKAQRWSESRRPGEAGQQPTSGSDS